MNDQAPRLNRATPRRRALVAALAAACLTLTGCLDWSGDVGRYRQILDGPPAAPPEGAPEGAPDSVSDTADARPAYDPAADLSLTHALSVANADNESIASAGEDYIQALAEKMRQAGTLLPTLTLGPSYNLTHVKGSAGQTVVIPDGAGGSTVVTRGGSDASTTKQFTVTGRASASGSLSDVSNIRAAGQTASQRAQLLLNQRQAVLLEVAQSYYDVLRFQRQTRVLQDSIKLQEERVRDQQARLDLGGGRPLDLAQSRADLAGTRAQLTSARTSAANARSALARLMGVDAVAGPLTDGFPPPAEVPGRDAWMGRALDNRQDLLAANRRVAAARQSVQAAIRQYLPTVSINFNYFLYNDPTSTRQWTGGVSASIPIFSALSIEASIRSAWSSYRQAGLARSQTHRQVVDDVRQGYQNLVSSRQRIIDLQTQVDAAQEAYDLAQRAYELGGQSNLDRLTQQDTLRSARLDLVDEQFNEKTAYLSLLRAAGQLDRVLPEKVARQAAPPRPTSAPPGIEIESAVAMRRR